MDIEFHYYMTYLTAARAGFPPVEALLIAQSSQYVDDNDTAFLVSEPGKPDYKSYVSQTFNVLKPRRNLFRIYPIFHFIPGDPQAASARRKDGKMHWLTTTPGSGHAARILDAALSARGDHRLYRIGIGCHGFADTWAHQNFVGYFDAYNAMRGMLERAAPDIGHADAGHQPDIPALEWEDARLLGRHRMASNATRFLDAAESLFLKLAGHSGRQWSNGEARAESLRLRSDLQMAMGSPHRARDGKEKRIIRYLDLAKQTAYGARALPPYDEWRWVREAITGPLLSARSKFQHWCRRVDIGTEGFMWRDPARHEATHWFRFQVAVKEHQKECMEYLDKELRSLMQLEAF